jgi:hypothetical protein
MQLTNDFLTLCAMIVVGVILWEGFETIILPRSVSRGFRLTRYFFIWFWSVWRGAASLVKSEDEREGFYAYFGPLSLILLLIFWASLLILGFGFIQYFHGIGKMTNAHSLYDTLYYSGVTFCTLGYGDIVPTSRFGKCWAVIEAGTGFGFLAIVIGYLPVLYQAFSRREVAISLLDARAGSPPTATELLVRYGQTGNLQKLEELLREWEMWTSDVLESHLSYPVLAFYRSQHSRQSWIAALTAMLDVCAAIQVGIEKGPEWQARLTFAMARHAVVDLTMIFRTPPLFHMDERLPSEEMQLMRERLERAGVPFCNQVSSEEELAKLRRSYEPYVAALSERFKMPLPPWVQTLDLPDDWQTTGWDDGILK